MSSWDENECGRPPRATPTFAPPPGAYLTPQSETISEAIAGATIHYTTDEKAPRPPRPNTAEQSASKKYTVAIAVAATETIEAIAVATGYGKSAVATAVFTI